MATYSPRLLGLTAELHQTWPAKPSKDRPTLENGSDENIEERIPDEVYDGSNYFKSAHW